MLRDKLFVVVLFLAVICVLMTAGMQEKLYGASGDSVIVIFSGESGEAEVSGGWADDGTIIRLESVDDSVGIGTATPSEKLEVNGTVKAISFIGDGSGLTGISEGDPSYGSSASSPVDAVYVDDDGDVGIGTTEPNEKLDVRGGIISKSANYTTSSVTADITFGTAIFHAISRGTGGPHPAVLSLERPDLGHRWDTQLTNDPALQILYNDSEKMRITTDGNVGIGTTSPEYALNINNGPFSGSTYKSLKISHTNDANYPRYHLIDFDVVPAGGGDPYTAIRLMTGRHVAPPGQFRLYGSRSDMTTLQSFITGSMGTNADDARLNLLSEGGNVGIGTSASASYRLYVNGSAYSTGGWSSSDINLKKNIQPLSNVLPKLDNITGVMFNWRIDEFPDKGFDDRPHIGLIAQEVEKEFPELINYDNEGYKALSYDGFVVVLLQAVKEQQKQIEAQQQQIDQLKALIKSVTQNIK